MGFWDEVSDPETKANSNGSTGYFYPGHYLVALERTKHLLPKSKGGNARKEAFVIEATPLAVRSEHPQAPSVGEKRAHVITGFGGEWHDLAIGDARAFVEAVVGGPAAALALTPQQWAEVRARVDGEGLKGMPMRLECWSNKNGKFTIHKWARATAADFAKFGVPLPGAAG